MRLGMKYPEEAVVLSWDFTAELSGRKAAKVATEILVDRGSRIGDESVASVLAQGPWIEYGVPIDEDGRRDPSAHRDVVFQRVVGGKHGVDYRVFASVTTEDELTYRKLSILPVRDA